ncbi:MAG: tripartite tricarboxylate transporter substrate binding protein [Comamonadaceae bacterium]|nr:MAG: tripartite tricarboxylate transporter substrate binding protein [Comamonadaceae bacterium]
MLTRARFLRAISAVAMAGASLLAHAADPAWPTKPIRLIVLYTPGGASDIIARTLGQKLSESLGQPVVVDNRPGGNGFIGLDIAAHAPADGYTLVLGAAPLVVSPALFKSMPFDPVKDFVPISLVARTLNVLVAAKSLPANNAAEFIALAKAKPGEYSYASASPLFTLASELINTSAQLDLLQVRYKGVAEALTDVSAGRVSVMVDTVGAQMPHIKGGRVKPLAVLSKSRHPNLPDVPTMAESGLPGYDEEGWVGLLAPKGTPQDIVTRLNKEIVAALKLSDVQAKLDGLGFVTASSTPDQLADRIRTDIARYIKVANDAKIPKE